MGEDYFNTKIKSFVKTINRYPSINEAGLKKSKFPDDTIESLHNHLGNMMQLLSGVTSAMNAADQFLMVKNAEKELVELQDDLYKLHSKDIIIDRTYIVLTREAKDLEEVLSSGFDEDYV